MAQRTDYKDGDVIFADFLNNTNRAVNDLDDKVKEIEEKGIAADVNFGTLTDKTDQDCIINELFD